MKSDERLLGDSDFVERVFEEAEESLEQKYDLTAKGYDRYFFQPSNRTA